VIHSVFLTFFLSILAGRGQGEHFAGSHLGPLADRFHFGPYLFSGKAGAVFGDEYFTGDGPFLFRVLF